MKNTLKKFAIVMLAIMFIVNTVAMAALVITDKSEPHKASASAEATYTPEKEETKIPEKETAERVLLVDKSGSMANNNYAYVGFDDVIGFNDSRIIQHTVETFENGAKYVVYAADLESYPYEEDTHAADGKEFENVYLAFSVPNDVESKYVDLYKEIWADVLDRDNCSLIFIYQDGSKMVVFDNYEENQPEEIPAIPEEELKLKVDVECEVDDCVPFKALVIFVGTIIDLFIIFAIILIALLGNGSKVDGVPDDIQDALKDTTAVDGSASVSDIYTQLIDWAKKMGLAQIYRFASTIEKMSISQAASMSADGATHGWSLLAELHKAGVNRVTIVSDMGFNDDQTIADGVTFEHITFVVPKDGYNQQILNEVAQMAISHKVITI